MLDDLFTYIGEGSRHGRSWGMQWVGKGGHVLMFCR